MKYVVVSNRRIQNAEYFDRPETLEFWLSYHPDIEILVFAFWSWKVPNWMLQKYKCYGVHTGFLLDSKGAGGSPIDNLQRLGVRWAALNVFEMTEVVDGGHVRLAIPMRINGDKAEVISTVDLWIPAIVEFLKQDISHVPARFVRVRQ
jgi:hypothetical protein